MFLIKHHTVKAFGALDKADTVDFMLIFENNLLYYVCSMTECIHIVLYSFEHKTLLGKCT